MTSAESVRTRLKNYAALSGKPMQEILTLYGLERTIYRLSISEYSERFTLKGGILLYAFFSGDFARTTSDIDLLAKNISNSITCVRNIFEDIFSIECDDALKYDLSTLDVRETAENREYHGVNISVKAFLDRTTVPVSIDIGFDDVIYPERIKMEFPVLLDMAVPEINAYSVYSVISEKFEAIVSLGDANSRYKDFYDIYVLACRYDLRSAELREAVKETFLHRKTGFDDIFAFEDGFINSEIHQQRWNAFLKKKKAMVNAGLADVMKVLKHLLLPVAESIRGGTEYTAKWDHESLCWRHQ